jgi:hypothetical protein
MRPKHSEVLRQMGFSGMLDEFRAALAEVKAGAFASWSIDELTFTRDEAAEFCRLVKDRLGAPRLTRVYILRALVGLRKNGKLMAKAQKGTSVPLMTPGSI